MAAIATTFGLELPEPDEVKRADNDLFDAEARRLMTGSLLGRGSRDFRGTIECWSPEKAKKMFLDRFQELSGVSA